MLLSNLFLSPKAFKIGVSPNGQILARREAVAQDGTLLVTGNSRHDVALKVSVVEGNHLIGLDNFTAEQQVVLLERVKVAIGKARLAVVFLYEAAWKRATLRSELKAQHRLQTLGHEAQAMQRRAKEPAWNQLGVRAALA